MKRFFLCCIAIWLLPAMALAEIEEAESEEEIFEPSKYGSLSLAIGVEQFDSLTIANQDVNDLSGFSFSEGLGVDIVLGSRWHPNFSVEAQFVYLEKLEDDNANLEIRYEVFTANLKFYPIRGLIEPYLLAGVGGGFFGVRVPIDKDSDLGSVARFGGGAELNISKTFALILGGGYLVTLGDINGMDVLEFKVGVVSRFW